MKKHNGGFCSLLLTSILFAAALAACPVHFLLDDDYALMQIVAGWRSGTPSFYNVYNNICFSAPLSMLYRWAPDIPWYPLVELLILFGGTYEVLKAVRKQAIAYGRGPVVTLMGIGAFLAAVLPNAIFLQYSVVASMAGAAACVGMLNREEGDPRGGFQIVFYTFLSFIIRAETGVVTLGMLLAATVMRRLRGETAAGSRNAGIRWTLLPLLFSAVLCMGAFFMQTGVEQSEPYRAYTAYNALRTDYMDYPHKDFSETSAYREAGWDRELYEMTENWYFLDSRFQADSLETVLRGASRPETAGERLKGIIPSFRSTIRVTNLVRNLFLLMLGLTAALSVRRLLGKDYRGLVRGLIPMTCFFAASGLLCFLGRYPQHAFYACALPAFFMTLYEWARLPKAGVMSKTVGIAAVAAALALGYNSGAHVYALANSEAYQNQEARAQAIDRYCMEHGNRAVITDYSVRGAGSPFVTSREEHPLNRFFWGGWYYGTPFYQAQLRTNGLDALDENSFLDERVLLLNDSQELLELTTDYLSKVHGPVRAVEVDRGQGFTAYRFEPESAQQPERTGDGA